jgi:hypothetical protein
MQPVLACVIGHFAQPIIPFFEENCSDAASSVWPAVWSDRQVHYGSSLTGSLAGSLQWFTSRFTTEFATGYSHCTSPVGFGCRCRLFPTGNFGVPGLGLQAFVQPPAILVRG